MLGMLNVIVLFSGVFLLDKFLRPVVRMRAMATAEGDDTGRRTALHIGAIVVGTLLPLTFIFSFFWKDTLAKALEAWIIVFFMMASVISLGFHQEFKKTHKRHLIARKPHDR